MTAPGLTASGILALTGGIAATIIGISGAWRVLRSIVGAAFDGAVWDALKRKSPELAEHMRQQVFASELARVTETRAVADNAMRLCESNAAAIERLLVSHERMADDISALPRVSAALEAVAGTLGRMETRLDDATKQIEFVHGMVEAQMRNHS